MGSSVDGRRSSSYNEARQGMFAARMYIGRVYEALHTLLFGALFSGGRRSGRCRSGPVQHWSYLWFDITTPLLSGSMPLPFKVHIKHSLGQRHVHF